jgi:hypothetical protein
VQALAALHAGGVLGRADQVAAVVEVHVQVAAVPAGGGRVDQPGRVGLDGAARPDPALDDAELQAARAADGQRHVRHGQRDVGGVEERPVPHVPLVRHAVREPGAAGVVGHRPPRAVRRDQPHLGGVPHLDHPVEHQRPVAQHDLERRAVEVEGPELGATGRDGHRMTVHCELRVHR